jgi:chromosomal replication initiator protein
MDEIEILKTAAAAYFGLRPARFAGPERHPAVARPRMVVMYLARTLFGVTLERIGAAFRRDHTTVLHAVRRVADLRASDAATRSDLAALEERLLFVRPQV